MKKYFIILTMALAASALFSCTKEVKEDSSVVSGKVPMQFSAEGEEFGTKADIVFPNIVWDDADAIAVFDGTDVNEFTLTSGAGTVSGDFSGEAAQADLYAAIAPYSQASYSGDAFKAKIPSTQTIVGAHKVDDKGLISTAKTPGSTLNFSNQFALVKVNISRSDVVSVLLKGNNSEIICGSKHYDYENDEMTGSPEGTNVRIVYKATSEGENTVFPAGDYYMAIWPTTFSGGYTLIMTLSDGSRTAKWVNSERELGRNGGQNMGTVDTGSTFVPSTITTAAQLKMWRRVAEDYVEGEEVKLGADIDLEGFAWTPVYSFYGIFNGQDHKIYNFTIDNPSDNRIGFIRTLGSSSGQAAVLKNVIFGSEDGLSPDGSSSIALSVESSSSWSYAGIVGYAHKNSHVLNVKNYVPVSAAASVTTKHAVAGIAGAAGEAAVIESCINYADITSNAACSSTEDSAVGGVLGSTGSSDVQVLSCTNEGTIENKCVGVSCIGGVVAKSSGTGMLVDECVNEGAIKNSAASVGSTKGNWDISVGGVIGFMGNTTTVNKCSNNGRLYNTVTTNSDYDVCFGGVVGATTKNGCVIKGCSNTAEFMYADKTAFTSWLAAGGILGYSRGVITITRADDGTRTTNTGQFFQRRNHTKAFYVGGIAGYIEKQATSVVEYCTNYGRIIGSDPQTTDKVNFHGGGICGGVSTGIVRDCINEGFLIARDGNLVAWFGGIAGAKDKYATSILNCVNNGAISGYNSSASSSIGGLLAVLQPDQTTVRNCTNNGLITTGNIYTKASGNTPGEPVSFQNKDYYKGGLFGYVNAPKADVTDNVTGCVINCTLSNQTVGKDNYSGIITGQTKSTASTAYKLVFGTPSDPVMIVNSSHFEYGTGSNPATITPGDVMNTDANVKKWLMGSTSKLYDATNGSSNTDIVDFHYSIVTAAAAGIE